MNKIFVNCGGSLYQYDSKEEVMNFFEDCISGSEGSERERYTNIYFSVKEHLNDNKRCFTDGTSYIYDSDIDPNEIDSLDESLLKTNFKVTKEDLLLFKANRCLAINHSRIYPRTMERYNNFEELYDDYLSKSKDRYFYLFENDKIICFDTTASGSGKYWCEEFKLEDYEYANKWLNNEIEYEDYLNKTEIDLNKITVKDMLDYKLEDDGSSTGGLSFAGETLKDFLDEELEELNLEDSLDTSIFWINDRLKVCGVKEITVSDCIGYFNSKNEEDIEL